MTAGRALTPLGRCDWTSIRARMAEATCVWTDLDGLHAGAVPDQAPIATHLWAWRTEGEGAYLAWRWRIDGDTAIGAELRFEKASLAAATSLQARATPDRGLADELAGLADTVRLMQVGDEAPILFLVPDAE